MNESETNLVPVEVYEINGNIISIPVLVEIVKWMQNQPLTGWGVNIITREHLNPRIVSQCEVEIHDPRLQTLFEIRWASKFSSKGTAWIQK